MCCQSLWMTWRYILECLLTLSAHSFCSAGFTDEDTENGGEKVREEKVRVEKDGGKSNWYLSLITGMPITFFIFAIPAVVIIYKRLKKCMKSPEKALNNRSESLPLSSWMTVGPAVAQQWKHLCKTTRDPCCISLVFVHLWWFKMLSLTTIINICTGYSQESDSLVKWGKEVVWANCRYGLWPVNYTGCYAHY